jgi:hypothetical protein
MSKKLNENQLLAVPLVASGMSGQLVAKELNIQPETLSRWKNDSEFMAGVNKIIVDAQEATQAKLSQLTTQALKVIEDALCDEAEPTSVRLNVAFKVLDKVGEPKRQLETNAKKIASQKLIDEMFL